MALIMNHTLFPKLNSQDEEIKLIIQELANFEDVRNIFIDESQSAGLEFNLYGQQYILKFKYNWDWADPDFFKSVGAIIKPYLKKNIYKVSEGQGGIYVSLTRETMIKVSNFFTF